MVQYTLYESVFPHFSPVTITAKERINQYTAGFPPSSDYNFFGVWSYNVNDRTMYSFLNGNLVMLFEEYSGDGMFLSFLGNQQVVRTAHILLEYSRRHGLPACLKLLPECNFTYLSHHELTKIYTLEEDEDNHDYILFVDDLINLQGSALHQKKKTLFKFMRTYQQSNVLICPLSGEGVSKELLRIFHIWELSRNRGDVNVHEIRAMERTVANAENFDLYVLFARNNDDIIGYTLFEFVHEDYVISAFQKADRTYFGVFEFMNHSLAKFVKEYGVSWINIEQDLGIEGLRQAKRKYNPRYYKKYILSSH